MIGSAEAAMVEGKASLQKVVAWASTDAAGPSLPLLQAALLDLASLHLPAGAVPAALACLQAAAAVGRCLSHLTKAPQALGPVNPSCVPTWAVQLLQGMPVPRKCAHLMPCIFLVDVMSLSQQHVPCRRTSSEVTPCWKLCHALIQKPINRLSSLLVQ